MADKFLAHRAQSRIGVEVASEWARHLPRSASILDLGCGSGVPISAALMEEGFEVHGIDASPTLVAAYRTNFPHASVACESAETSNLFGRTFDAAILSEAHLTLVGDYTDEGESYYYHALKQ